MRTGKRVRDDDERGGMFFGKKKKMKKMDLDDNYRYFPTRENTCVGKKLMTARY